MDIDLVLIQLQKVEDSLKCNVCSKKCTNPVRIKVCGHYFCLRCLKIKYHTCPICKTYYEDREIDRENIAKHSDDLLMELKTSLLESSPPNEAVDRNDVEILESKDGTKNIFQHNNKEYHVNYIDDKYKVNAKGETPLHIACKKKRLDDVVALIKSKCDLNCIDFAGWAPLHEAVESGSVEIVEILLKSGVLIDIPGGEYTTPLHKAVNLGSVRMIELLLKYNPNTDLIDYFGRKPLEYAKDDSIKSVFTNKIDCIPRVEELFCRTNVNAFFYYIEESYKQKLAKSKFAKVIKEYDAKKVSHFFIRKTHKLSLKILVAMLDGCFILPQEWIDDFLNGKYFVSVPNYTFISKPDLNNGIRKAMLNSMLKLPKLFDGMSFFIHGHNKSVEIHNFKFSKSSISSLITSGGGKILRRAPTPSTCENIHNYPFHSNLNGNVSRCCHFLIYEETNPPALQYQMAEIKHKTSKWLIDCVVNFEIVM